MCHIVEIIFAAFIGVLGGAELIWILTPIHTDDAYKVSFYRYNEDGKYGGDLQWVVHIKGDNVMDTVQGYYVVQKEEGK
jgi:hypothetical protein